MTVDPKLLRHWYLGLASLGTILATWAIIFPQWPSAQSLNQTSLNSRLKAAGFGAKQLPPKAATRTYDLASSAQLIWKLPSGNELSMMRSTSREYENFQVAFLARSQPDISLKNRKLLTTPFPIASGHLKGRQILQTCIFPTSTGEAGLGVTNLQLGKVRSSSPAPKTTRLLEVMGFPPFTGYSCVLISLKSGKGNPAGNLSLFQNVVKSILPEFHLKNSTL